MRRIIRRRPLRKELVGIAGVSDRDHDRCDVSPPFVLQSILDEPLAHHAPGVPIDFRLVAVTDEQIEAFKLPTRPDKAGAGRAVELDALQVVAPGALEEILEGAIMSFIDAHAWAVEAAYERSERELLAGIAARERTSGGFSA